MKRYLQEMEVAGIILLIVGVIIGHIAGSQYGAWPCGAGLLLAIMTMIYKAWHWKEYERENKRNIIIVLVTIVLLYIMILKL